MKSLNNCLATFIALGLMLGVPMGALAERSGPVTFTTIDFPGALSTANLPQIWIRINSKGQIVGGYEDTS